MATWKKVLVSGSAIEVLNITASNIPDASGTAGDFLFIDSEGKLLKTGSAGGGGGIFTDQGTFYDTENSLKITGSTLQSAPVDNYDRTSSYNSSYLADNYAFIVSQSAYFDNHNVGHPNNLKWGTNLDGSIFNSYNATTDVSEILRTLVGLISSSHSSLVASPSPLATTYNGYRAEAEGFPSTTTAFDNIRLPQNFSEDNAIYLNHKGFNNGAGDTILGQVTGDVRYDEDNSYGVQIDLRNSAFSYGGEFDAGLNTTPLTLFADVTQSFSDNQTINNPNETSNTFTTQSNFTYAVNIGENTNGIVVTEIATGNPTVIPPQYKKATGTDISLQASRVNGGISYTNISSSGYYKYHGIKAGIATSSNATRADVIGLSLANPITQTSVNASYFFTPLQTADLTDTAASFNVSIAPFALTSRSLSGAPYANALAYEAIVTASNVFNPFYRNNDTVLGSSVDSTGLTFTGADETALITNLGTINSLNIYTGDTLQSLGNVPDINSTIRYKEYPITAGPADSTNITETGISDTSFIYRVTTTNFLGADTPDDTTVTYHTAGDFNQPVASGSLAYFISSNGSDSSTTIREQFKGEAYRRQISNSTTLTTAWDSGSRLTLGDGGDLQVKPGYLVNPEHNNTVSGAGKGYWYPTTGFSTSHYKWYLREFTIASATATLGITLYNGYENDLVTWDNTTINKFSIGLIFENQLNLVGSTYDRLRVYDIEKGTGAHSLNNQSQGNNNPFSDNIDVFGSFAGFSENLSTDKITLNLASAAGQVIGAGDKVWILIRYKGAPANTISNITLATS